MNHQISTAFYFLVVTVLIESSSVEPVQLSLTFTINIETNTSVYSKDSRLLDLVSKTTKTCKGSQDKTLILFVLSVVEKG